MSETASAVNGARGPAGSEASDLVWKFFGLLERGEAEAATDLLSPEARWINVSLPTIEGRDRVRQALTRWLAVPGAGFEVYVHKMAVDGGSVLTERTDVLRFGPVRIQIWVWGRFDVADGRITMWKDYFDFWNTTVGLARGLLGAVIPALRPRPPAAG